MKCFIEIEGNFADRCYIKSALKNHDKIERTEETFILYYQTVEDAQADIAKAFDNLKIFHPDILTKTKNCITLDDAKAIIKK